ncbi:MAG: FAD:protein FMN transferase, partial [Paracoccaceae bacterium]|nr:FAD:protein FMN transferase [Paracoccaceae bacterium]
MNRRRFLAISAGLAAFAAVPARATALYTWHGTAVGAAASISLAHPDAKAIVARAVAEISRLEDIFSLYRATSALSRLNAAGRLDAPPFELLECLAISARVHAATSGLFDPTVQPLWQLYATRHAAGAPPDTAAIAQVLPRVGWGRVAYDSAAVAMAPGMAITLNGIAQGYIADRVALLLRAEGLSDILINTGELRALGQAPGGAGWPVQIDGAGKIALQDRALASSAPLGTVFDAAGKAGHILDPLTGLAAPARWRLVSISAPQAALADALSTAACLMPDAASIKDVVAGFAGARLEHL